MLLFKGCQIRQYAKFKYIWRCARKYLCCVIADFGVALCCIGIALCCFISLTLIYGTMNSLSKHFLQTNQEFLDNSIDKYYEPIRQSMLMTELLGQSFPYFSFDVYKNLGEVVPSKLFENNSEIPFPRFQQMDTTFSWLPKTIVELTSSSLTSCILRRKELLKISFVGDSRTRILMEGIIRETKELQWTITYDGQAQFKPKHYPREASLSYFRNCELSFVPAFNSTTQLISKLKYLAELEGKSKPHFIVVSYLIWNVQEMRNDSLRGLDDALVDMDMVAQFLESTNFRKKGIVLIWYLNYPFNYLITFSSGEHKSSYLEWFNQISIWSLSPFTKSGSMLLWDSGVPFVFTIRNDCLQLSYAIPAANLTDEAVNTTNHDPFSPLDIFYSPNWICKDAVHLNPQGVALHLNILFTFICS